RFSRDWSSDVCSSDLVYPRNPWQKLSRSPEMSDQLQRLLGIMARLRDPVGGCPWDLAQDFSTIAPYTIEEAYEVADAIDRGDMRSEERRVGSEGRSRS